MKTIDEIEKLTVEQLEEAASNLNLAPPAGMKERIEDALAASVIASSKPRRTLSIAGGIAIAAALALAVILPTTQDNAPKDTFDDPLLAYEAVQNTFKTISENMSDGLSRVINAESAPAESTINKIHK